jgi:hypothetical protein
MVNKKIGQSKNTILDIRHRTKTNKTKKHNTENEEDQRHRLHQQNWI